MSALREEIKAALREELKEFLPELRDLVLASVLQAHAGGDPDQLLDAAAVGALLGGRTAEAVRRAHERGTLGVEPVRVGRRALRWRRGDVLALARGGR